MNKINIITITDEEITYKESKIYKNWKERVIFIPSEKLNEVQKNILLQIKEYFFSFDWLSNLKNDEFKYVYSYIKKRSIADMAKNHLWKNYVIRIDIKSFFNTITKEMIKKYMNLFFRENRIGIDNIENFIKVVSYHDSLPIGACTSPFISNVIGYYLLDKEISLFTQEKKLSYSRYADDLIFSSNNPNIKNEIENIIKIINKNGFEENRRKRKVYSKWKRQLVTWICVNWKIIPDLIWWLNWIEPTIPIEKRSEIRFYLHLINNFWISKALKFYNTKIYIYKKNPKNRKKIKNITEDTFLRIIKWKINYFNMINKWQAEKLMNDFKLITSF